MAVTGASYRPERCCFGGRYLQVIFVLLASSAVTTVLQVTAESKIRQAPDLDDPPGKLYSMGTAQDDDDATKSDSTSKDRLSETGLFPWEQEPASEGHPPPRPLPPDSPSWASKGRFSESGLFPWEQSPASDKNPAPGPLPPLPDSPSEAFSSRFSETALPPLEQYEKLPPLTQTKRRRQGVRGQMLRRAMERATRRHTLRKNILHSVKRSHQHQKQILGTLRGIRFKSTPSSKMGKEGTEIDQGKQKKHVMKKINSWSKGSSADSRGEGAAKSELDKHRKYVMKHLKAWSKDKGMSPWLGFGYTNKGQDSNPGKPPKFGTGLESYGSDGDMLYPFLDRKQAVNFFSPEAKVSKSKQWLQKLLKMVQEQTHRQDSEGGDPLDEYVDGTDSLDDDDVDFSRDKSDESDARYTSFDSSEEEDDSDLLGRPWESMEDSSESKDSSSAESDEDDDSLMETAEVDEPAEDPFDSEDRPSSESSDSDEEGVSDDADRPRKLRRDFNVLISRWSRKKLPPAAYPPRQHLFGLRGRRMQQWERRRFQAIKRRRNRLQTAKKRRLKAARRRKQANRRTPTGGPFNAGMMSLRRKNLHYTLFPLSPDRPSTNRRQFGRRPRHRRRRFRARKGFRRQLRKNTRHPFQAGLKNLQKNLGSTGSKANTHSGRTSTRERTSTTTTTNNNRNSEKETTTLTPFPRSSASADSDATTPAGRTTARSAKKSGSTSPAAGSDKSTASPHVDLAPVRATLLGRVEDRKPENYTLDFWEGRRTGSSGGGGRHRPDLQWPGGLYIRVPYNQQDTPLPLFPPEQDPADVLGRRRKRSADGDDVNDDDDSDDDDSNERSTDALRRPVYGRPTHQRRPGRRNTVPRVIGVNGYNGGDSNDGNSDDNDDDTSPFSSSPHARRRQDYSQDRRQRTVRRRYPTPRTDFNNADDRDDDNGNGNGRNSGAGGFGFVQIGGGRGNNYNRGSGAGGGGGERTARPVSRFQHQHRRHSQGDDARRRQRRLRMINARRERRLRRRQQQRRQRQQQQRQRQETDTSNARPSRDDDGDDEDASDGNAHQGGTRPRPRRPQIQHINIHNDDRNGDSETHFRSPFINHRTAYDFLSSQAGRRPGRGSRPYVVSGSRSSNNEQQSEQWQFSHTMSESLCEVFDKHFVPTNAGGRCV